MAYPPKRHIHKADLLTPPSGSIGEFLDFIIISDLASKYKYVIKQAKDPYISIPMNPNDFIELRCRFSGVNFDLEKTVAEEELLRVPQDRVIFKAIRLDGKIYKGIFTYWIHDSEGVDFSNRPDGTYVLIAFPIETDKFLIKTFVFN